MEEKIKDKSSNGLDISILKLSEVLENADFRIDGEFHQKPFDENTLYKYVNIGSILDLVQYGVSNEMNEEGNGFPIYRMNEMSNMLCDLEVLKCANLPFKEISPFILKDNDVLFNRTNSQVFVGRTGIFKHSSDTPHIFASYLIRLRPNEEFVLPEYLTTFLSSKFGVWDVKRRARISINQSNVNAEEVKAVKIPLLSLDLQKKLRELFRKAHQLRIESKALYAEAENLLLDELGLRDWSPSDDSISVKSFAESFNETGRLDSEYYQPKYDYALERLRNLTPKPLNIVPLETLLKELTNGGTPLRHNLSEGEIPFLTAEHIFDFRINYASEKRILPEHHFVDMQRTRLKQNDVLIAIKGKVGNAVVVDNPPHEANINQDVGLFRLKDGINPYYVVGFLNSIVGKAFIEQISTGQINPFLGLGNLKTLKIPIFEPELMNELGRHLKEKLNLANTIAQQSKGLLEIAKRAVEMAIEESEEAAVEWINEQIESGG